MLNRSSPLLRLALLRARVARAEAVSSRPHLDPIASSSPSRARLFATSEAATPSSSSSATHTQYEFALTPERRRVTIACATPPPTTTATPATPGRRRPPPTPVVVTTSADHERIVIRAPVGSWTSWTVALGPNGPEARETFVENPAATTDAATTTPPPVPLPPPLPLELEIPARFCGLDIASAGGDVTVGGAGVQEADVRIVVVVDQDPATTTTPTTTISAAGRLRCGASLELDAGARGLVRAKELSAAQLKVRGGGGVSIGRMSALDALVEAGAGLEVGALYGRAARLRLSGGGGIGGGIGGGGGGGIGGGAGPLPVLRVTQLSCEEDGASGGGDEGGATLEAWPPESGPVDVRVDGGLAGSARVASAGGGVSLAAVQAGRFRGLAVDSGGGDVDISLDTGMGGGGGGGGHGRGRGDAGPGQQQQQQQRFAAVRVVGGDGALSVDPALGLVPSSSSSSSSATFEGLVPVSGGDGGGQLLIDAGAKGRVSLRARSWMDGVMARARNKGG